MTNPYYHPESLGLTIIAEVEQGCGYDFDTTILFQKDDGTFWLAHDMGCSCPIPFDGFTFFSGLDRVVSMSDMTGMLRHLSAEGLITIRRKASEAGLR